MDFATTITGLMAADYLSAHSTRSWSLANQTSHFAFVGPMRIGPADGMEQTKKFCCSSDTRLRTTWLTFDPWHRRFVTRDTSESTKSRSSRSIARCGFLIRWRQLKSGAMRLEEWASENFSSAAWKASQMKLAI